MSDPRRAALYATLARTYDALAKLEADEAGVAVPANDGASTVPPAQPTKPKAPRKRPIRPVPPPVGDRPIDEVTMARVRRRLRGMGVPT